MENDAKQPYIPIDIVHRGQANPILKWMKRIFTPLSVGFLVYFGWQSRDILVAVFANAQINYLIISILILIIAHFLGPASAVMVLKTCGSSVHYGFALNTHVDRLPARYIPGGIWHTVGRSVDFYRYGIKPPYLTAFILLEYLLAVIVAFSLGGMAIWYFRGAAELWGKLAALATIGSLIGLTFIPMLLNRIVLKSVGQEVSYRFYLYCIAIYALAWSLLALAFICYFLAFPLALGNMSLLEIGGTYLFSWAIGFITIFAPQGIGIFEIVAGHLLTMPISLSSSATLIAGFRVVIFMADIILWALLRWVWSSHKSVYE